MNREVSAEEIAVIGMAGRFPGAENINEFWQNLCDGIESITEVTKKDLAALDIDPGLMDDPMYIRACAPLDDVEYFDASFFGYNPKEAEIMDPQHRIFLECAWTALEHAGYDALRYDGRIGIFGGIAFNSYLHNNIVMNPKLSKSVGDYQIMLANEKDYPATRVSYKLNLKGPSVNIQTACSSSGVAVHLACQSLLNGDSDMSLAGGCRVIVPTRAGYRYIDGAPLSSEGKIRAFDAKANGMVRGSGGGFIVLKRMEDALEDGDSIHAIIRSTAINNDGSDKIGFTAPSIDGQSDVISDAIALADIDAESVSYIETHGTGTKLGDPIEISALAKAFAEFTNRKNFCAIGSVKTNIGHLDAGAGVAGIIKTILALKHKLIPPSLNFETPNPHIDFNNSPFFVNTKLVEWDAKNTPRRAGVSAFGMGGSNFHGILEEAPEIEQPGRTRPWQVLTLSTKTETALDTATQNISEYLKSNSDINIGDVAYTLHVGRKEFAYRRAIICKDVNNAVTSINSEEKKRFYTGQINSITPSVVFMFPGQGAQYINMGLDLYENEETFKKHVDTCSEILKPLLDLDIRKILYPERGQTDNSSQMLRQTRVTQPALFVIEYALAKLWMEWGIQPEAMIGHSVGEYVAACLSDVFKLEDALSVLAERARLIQEMPVGSMRAVRLPEKDVRRYLSNGLSIAACNAPSLCVVSGQTDAVKKFDKAMHQQDVKTIELHTSHAFHSEMMEPVKGPFAQSFSDITLNDPQIPFISCLTGTWITSEDAKDPKYWAKQLRQPVQFSNGILELQKKPGRLLIEVGPGTTLSTFAKQHAGSKTDQTVLTSLHHPREKRSALSCMLGTLGQTWLAGCSIDWRGFYRNERRRRIVLPTYPFEKKRYWVDPTKLPEKNALAEKQDGSIPEIDKVPPPPLLAAQDKKISAKSQKREILNKLKDIMYDFSGIELEESDYSVNFIEMGLDSLFLTQISAMIGKEFGIKVRFRQLFDELSTIDSLSEFINNKLPEEISDKDDKQPDSISEEQSSSKEQYPTAGPSKDTSKVFGAATRIEKSHSTALLPEQQVYIDNFIKKYNKKTKGSKQFAQANRARHADPRVVSGFNLVLKEMVYPVVVNRSSGSMVWDMDGNEYVDMTNSFGANFFGYSPPFVTKAIKNQLKMGFEIGPQHPLVGEVAGLICELTGFERAAFCNTGSEAVLGAMRIARTVTGRSTIAVFSGSYHGINDEVIVRGTKQLKSIPGAAGIMPSAVQNVIVLEYGEPESIEILKNRQDELAAIMVEPVQSRNLNLQPKEFLHELQRLTEKSETALIFDEVITGFRSHIGGAQAYFGVQADLATYGKVIGGGLSIGVVAGRSPYMDALDGGLWQYGDTSVPEVGVTYFAGTFVRHPLALAAAKASLEHLKNQGPELQQKLNRKMTACVEELRTFLREVQAPITISHFSSAFRVNFVREHPCNGLLFYLMRYKGVHILEGFTWFLTTTHSDGDIAFVISAFKESIIEMRKYGFLEPSTSIDLDEQQSIIQPPIIVDSNHPPVPGAKLGKDPKGNPAWFVHDPDRQGKYLQVGSVQ